VSSIITITELQNIEAVAMKYTIQNLGCNIRPRKALLEKEGLLKVPLQAIVPRQVTKRDRETKIFVYHLDNVGHLLYEKIDNKFVLISSITAGTIEREITQRFANLTESIEREILKEGKTNWGKLSWIKTFLRPLYSIVIDLVTSPNRISVDSLARADDSAGRARHWRYARLLIDEGYAQVDRKTPEQIIPTNKLTMAYEQYYRARKNGLIHNFAEIIVGGVFANRYVEIKKELRIYNPTAYVDTTKVYYIDALRYGENIPIHEDNLLYEYLKIGERTLTPEITKRRFRTLLYELESVNLLEKKGDYVTGKTKFFNNLMEYRDEILEGSIEAPKVVGL
jgi:hypothetical protein